jgi:hypothetical protein
MRLPRNKFLAGAAAAVCLAVPGAALANHVSDVDGPAVSSVNGICSSVHGKTWRGYQMEAAKVYWNAFLSTGYLPYAQLAQEHLVYVEWFNQVCSESVVHGL